jgi:hypothetical protein
MNGGKACLLKIGGGYNNERAYSVSVEQRLAQPPRSVFRGCPKIDKKTSIANLYLGQKVGPYLFANNRFYVPPLLALRMCGHRYALSQEQRHFRSFI